MSAPSPVQLAGTIVSVNITSRGQPLNSSYQVASVDIWTGVNKLPKARLVISDGNPASNTFPISETAELIPGAEISISLGYDQNATQVFSGVIYRQGLDISQNGPSRLIVEAADKSMVMTLARKNAIFEDMTDAAMMQQLIRDNGLTADVAATRDVQPAIVQFYSTDWDLLVIRAQVNGMVVTVADAAVTVAAPDTTRAPVLSLKYGESILDFQAAMDASTQYTASAIQSFAWDPAAQNVTTSGTASADVTSPGNLTSDELAAVFGVTQNRQQTGGTLETNALTTWSSAELLKTRLSKIRGEVRFQGNALATPACMVSLEGLGDRFNGNAYVSGIHHCVREGLWTTSAEMGLSAAWFAATAPNVCAPGAAGQLPAIANMQTGIVLKIDNDPEGEFRVQVSLPLLQAGTLGLWARLGSFYASNGFGAEFYPEVDDEVVVAFMNGDPRFPIIVGALYSKKHPPNITPDAQNKQKSIVTRSKLRIDFFEENPAVEIATPGGQSVRLDDKSNTVTVKDSNGNTVTLASTGITLDSASKVSINAKTDIVLSAAGAVSITGKAGVKLAGLSIQANAETSFAAQGSAEAKLISSGMVVVEGAMVKIN